MSSIKIHSKGYALPARGSFGGGRDVKRPVGAGETYPVGMLLQIVRNDSEELVWWQVLFLRLSFREVFIWNKTNPRKKEIS